MLLVFRPGLNLFPVEPGLRTGFGKLSDPGDIDRIVALDSRTGYLETVDSPAWARKAVRSFGYLEEMLCNLIAAVAKIFIKRHRNNLSIPCLKEERGYTSNQVP